MSFHFTPVASGYQKIHPYSAMNINSVKINTSLIMMKECLIRSGSLEEQYFDDGWKEECLIVSIQCMVG